MASYTVASGRRGVQAKTLQANVVDTVSFTDNVDQVEILTDGAHPVYVTVDGAAPTLEGDHTDVLPAGGAAVRTLSAPGWTGGVVRLISAGPVVYSVTRLS